MQSRLFLIFLILASLSYAQKYNFVNWSVEDGMIQSQASCISQDQYRQLWIGTEGGISRFDGRKFSNLTVQEGLPTNRIITLLNTTDGRMFVGTSNGLSEFTGRRFKKILVGNDPVNNVFGLAEANDHIYSLINFRLFEIGQSASKRIIVSGDSTERITCIQQHKGALLVYVYKKGLFNWNGSRSIQVGYSPEGNMNVRRIFITAGADTLFLASRGLLKLRSGRFEPVDYAVEATARKNLLCITEDQRNNIWIGTDHGVLRFENGKAVLFDEQSGFTDNSVNVIYRDVENNLWFGTNGDGIFKFRENTFTYYDQSAGLASSIVMGIAQTSDGLIYTGGYGRGLYQLDANNKLSAVPLNDPKWEDHKINCLYADKENTLLIGTLYHGPWIYQKQKGIKPLITKNHQETVIQGITCFLRDEQNQLLIGSQQGLFLVTKHDSLKPLQMKVGLITALKQFDHEHVLVGTSKGMFLLDQYYHAEPFYETHFGNASILCLSRKDEHLWIGTTDNGVTNFNIKTNKIIQYNTTHGLPSNFIYSIDVSEGQRVWIGTGFGISNLQLDEEGKVKAIKNYGRSDGLLGMECNHNSILRAADGSMWFGTTKGLFHFNPKAGVTEKNQPLVFLRSVKLFSSPVATKDEQWFDVPKELKLSSKENHLSFEMGSIYFTNPGDVLFRYKLEGIDKDYTNTANPLIIYPSLPPGRYELKAYGITKSGVISSNSISYRFEIEKAFYQTRWFQFFAVLFLIGSGALLAYLITRSRQKRKQREKEILQKIREEEFMKLRQRTAEDFHDEMGNSLTRISVLTDVLKSKINGREQEVTRLVEQIKENTTALYNGSRDIIWSLNAENDGLYEITEHVRDIGRELFSETDIDFVFHHSIAPTSGLKLKLDYSRNLTMIFKEVYNNIHKHAGATAVKILLELAEPNGLSIEIRDNGKGFDPNLASEGNGVRNIANRCKRLNGKMELNSAPGKGTEMRITLKNLFV